MATKTRRDKETINTRKETRKQYERDSNTKRREHIKDEEKGESERTIPHHTIAYHSIT